MGYKHSNESLRDAIKYFVKIYPYTYREFINDISDDDREEALKKYGSPYEWDTSEVTDMSYLFDQDALKDMNMNRNRYDYEHYEYDYYGKNGDDLIFEYDISDWDVSNVVTMEGMFMCTQNRSIESIKNWDTSKVTNMKKMFFVSHIKIDLKYLNVSNVTNME